MKRNVKALVVVSQHIHVGDLAGLPSKLILDGVVKAAYAQRPVLPLCYFVDGIFTGIGDEGEFDVMIYQNRCHPGDVINASQCLGIPIHFGDGRRVVTGFGHVKRSGVGDPDIVAIKDAIQF